MSTNWNFKKLRDIAETVSMTYDFADKSEIIFINTGDIFEGKFLHKRYVSTKGLPGQAKKRIFKDNILLSEIRPANKRFAFIDFDADDYVVSTKLMVIRAKEEVLPKYLYIVLTNSKTLEEFQYIAESRSGTFPQITFDSISYYPIQVPSPKEQQAIIEIISSIDDKIKLNRKMNETLEATTRAIFKSWFVNFEPIPGFGSHKEWQDSQLGKIPKGWKAGSLGKISEIVMGQSPLGETYNENREGLPFYQGIRDFGFCFPSKRVYCTSPTRLAQKGDVLLSVRAPVGRLNIAGEDCAIGRGVAALRIKGQHYGFLYCLMKETQGGWEKHEAEGTVFGSATKTDVQKFSIIIPPAELIETFNKVVFPIDETIKNNETQSRTLASIRDASLPKLLSGVIRVKDAERFVETCPEKA